MDKKNIVLLLVGSILYTIGFFSFNIIGKISFLIGGILLSILLIKIGDKVKIKKRILGNALRIFGIAYGVLLVILMPVAIVWSYF